MSKQIPVFVFLFLLGINHSWATQLSLSITGLSGPELDNVANSLQLAQLLDKQSLLQKLTGETPSDVGDVPDGRIKRLHRSAKADIQQALQPFGFYKPAIESSLQFVDGVWQASYAITPGDAVLLSNVDVSVTGSGKDLSPVKEVLANSPLRVGQRLQHQQYNDTKSSLLKAAIDNGYLDAGFKKSAIRVNPATNSASVTLLLETGEAYYFGPVTINQEILRNEFINRYVPFSEGDLFSTERLVSLQLALGDSGYFDRVELTADRENAENYRIPVLVDTTAARPRKYTVGFGYGTDTGPRVKAGAEFRRVNQRGHNIHTDFLVSKVKSSATAQYEIPLGSAGQDSLRFIAQHERADVGDAEIRKSLVGVNYNDTWRKYQRRLYLEYQIEDFRFGEEPFRDAELLVPGINLQYTKADNVLLPTDGYSWFLDVHGGLDSVVSDTTFVQGRAVLQRVWSPRERTRLLGRLEVGATRADNFDRLPPSQRFFAGGDRSVRGYAYESLGPKNANGDVTGGRYLAAASIELDHLVYKDIGGALFFDTGGASNDPDFSWSRGVGVGVRWRSPVGMFKLDLAKPLDNTEESFRIHLSIGADL